MLRISSGQEQGASRLINRREFLVQTGAVGTTATLAVAFPSGAALAQTPRKGGVLKQGLNAGSTTDTLDPALITTVFGENIGWQLFNSLVEINDKKEAVPELAESWEAKPGATEWIFNLKRGVHFNNGKEMTADDVIFSLQHHMKPSSKSGAKPLLSSIQEIKKTGPYQFRVTLSSGNVFLPYTFAYPYLLVFPENHEDWSSPVGTGPYVLDAYNPGVRVFAKRNPNYWKPNRAHFDAVETLVINDVTARVNALVSGAVHIINRIDNRTVTRLANVAGIVIQRTPGGQHSTFVMDCESDPFKDNNVRLALKHAIDRELILRTVHQGYGALANDHPIRANDPAFNAALPQRQYDPDRAKFYWKQSGLSGVAIELVTSPAATANAQDQAVLFQESTKRIGINIAVKLMPADGYFSKVWMKVPFCMSNWQGGPTADSIFSIGYKSDAAWNDARWRRADFDKLLLAARAEFDTDKRNTMYWEMQRMVNEDGGNIIPAFIDYIDATSSKLKGYVPNPFRECAGERLAEQAWFED